MSLRKKYKKFAAGGFATFSYSPKWLDQLSEFDRKPLIIFINYDSTKKYIQAINIHWLTVNQRKVLIKLMKRKFDIGDFNDFGSPISGLTYNFIKKVFPGALIAYRRYFVNRIRNLSFTPAWQWDPKEVEDNVIQSNTARIVGVTPEMIQKLAIRAMKERGRTKVKKARARGKARRRTRIRR